MKTKLTCLQLHEQRERQHRITLAQLVGRIDITAAFWENSEHLVLITERSNGLHVNVVRAKGLRYGFVKSRDLKRAIKLGRKIVADMETYESRKARFKNLITALQEIGETM